MKPILAPLILALTLFLIACQTEDQTPLDQFPEPQQGVEQPDPGDFQIRDRKLIKTGMLEFEVENLSATRDSLLQEVKKWNAFISHENERQTAGRRSNILEIRVAPQHFDDLLEGISKGVAEFERKEIRATDVTEEFVDVEARLTAKKALEERYLVLLNRAESIYDILEIEREANQIRTEIESIEARFISLKNRIAYSTIRVTMYEQTELPNRLGQQFQDGLQNGWDALTLVLIALTNIWPFLLIMGGILFVIKRTRNRRA